jgi:hypothetical protein
MKKQVETAANPFSAIFDCQKIAAGEYGYRDMKNLLYFCPQNNIRYAILQKHKSSQG